MEKEIGLELATTIEDEEQEHETSNMEGAMFTDDEEEEDDFDSDDDTIENERVDVDVDVKNSLVGLKRNTLEELHMLYRQHSRAIGFGVRKSTTRKLFIPIIQQSNPTPSKTPSVMIENQPATTENTLSNPETLSLILENQSAKTKKPPNPDNRGALQGIIYEKYFVCSCQGSMNKGKSDKSSLEDIITKTEQKKRKQRRIPHTRTGCNASLRVKLNKEGLYEVVNHILLHNHPMTPLQWQHHHRSERAIQPDEGEMIQTMTEARVPASVQFRYLSASSGGEKLLGHTEKDLFNYVHRLKMKKIAGGDAQTLHDMLKKRATEDPSFFYSIKYGDGGIIQNIFWRDGMMKEDYLLYNDVMIFDTTYRTNRYNLICGAFVGINNHWSNVMFGCAFLSDEKTESFEWLFNTFNESMGVAVSPSSIFTDQDQAMTNAIQKVWPMSRHRLCQWHIQQNAISHFGSLKKDSTFQNVFNKCLKGCFSEIEFEATWKKMLTDYGLVKNTWFQRLYGLREKWSTAFSKHIFSAGILSSQRSESTNHAMGFHANKTTSLTDFYGIFTNTVNRWRSEEERNEFQCSRATPNLNTLTVGLLKSASKVYTLNLFKRFEQEFLYSLGTKAMFLNTSDTGLVYKVYPEDDPESSHFVVFDEASSFITCSCGNWEETKLLCFHSLRVLHLCSMTSIPKKYVAKRWSKYAKTEVWDRFSDESVNQTNNDITWLKDMRRKFHILLSKCQLDKAEERAILELSYTNAMATLDSLRKPSVVSCSVSKDTISDPLRSTTKGRSVRLKRGSNSKKPKHQGSRSSIVENHIPFSPNPRIL